MPTYSHSRISTFEQCALKFKFQYIDKVETEVENSIEAFMGSRVHEVLEKLYKDLKFAKINELKDLLEYYDEIWKKNWSDGIVVIRKEYTPENYRKMGEKFISDYYKRYYPFDAGKTLGLETRIVLKMGKYTVQGYIDRLTAMPDGVYEIHDYKTANSLPTQEKIDTDRQLALYSIAVKQMYADCKKVELVWHYLAFDKEVRSRRSDEELEELKKEIEAAIDKIESAQDFPAKQSALCDWCQFQNICPNFKHLYELNDKDENEYRDDSGLNLVNEFSKLKKEEAELSVKMEKIREALVEFAEREGVNNVYGTDSIAWVKRYPKLSFPKKSDFNREEFEDMIKKLGLWDKVSTVDVYGLAKMINNGELHSEFVKVLEKFYTKGTNLYVKLRDRK